MKVIQFRKLATGDEVAARLQGLRKVLATVQKCIDDAQAEFDQILNERCHTCTASHAQCGTSACPEDAFIRSAHPPEENHSSGFSPQRSRRI